MTESCGSIEVLPAFEASDVFVSSCGLNDTGPVITGATLTYVFDVQNDNTVDAVADAQLLIDGTVEATQQVSIGPSSSTQVSLDVEFTQPGTYDISAQVTNAVRQNSVSGL